LGLLGALAVTLSPAIPPERVLLPPERKDDEPEARRDGKPDFTREERAELAKLSGKAKKARVRELLAKHSRVAKWTS
jgi:hypothetical protein